MLSEEHLQLQQLIAKGEHEHRFRFTSPDSRVGLAPKDYPPAGQKFFKDYKAKYGGGDPGQYAIFGFESMGLVLDAIKRAGDQGNDRAAVLEQIMSTKDRQSPIGTYSITDTGDTTLTNYGVYGIKDGSLDYIEAVEAPSSG